LVSNATKYNSKATIEVTAEIKNDCNYITISDNGKGMSIQNLDRINSIKNRQKAYSVSENSESSGLGFIIITELLAILNGTFDIKSNIHGTQITLEIPIDTITNSYK
jgi:signal transduction histidine kinase